MATTVTVPLRFEYGFLRQALLAHVYNTEGSLTAFQNSSGCTQVILSDPRLSGKNGQLHLSQQAEIKLGAAISDQCTFLIDWRGRLSTWHQPKTAANGSVLRFPEETGELEKVCARSMAEAAFFNEGGVKAHTCCTPETVRVETPVKGGGC